MIKRTEKLGITLLLSVAFAGLSACEVFANNTLSQVDVRKNSSDSLEFTLYTSSPYAENVVVTKKSDNKYVILMPNVNGTTNSKPDFSGVKDIVTDIDVRAVNDGSNGYTKVTVITNRAVDIKTNTAKSVAPTQGQKEYRALIAQQQTKPAATQTTTPVTPAVSAFKLPEIQPTKTANEVKQSVAPVAKPTQQPVAKPTQVANTKQQVAKPQTTQKATSTKPVASTTTKKVEAKPAVAKKITPAPAPQVEIEKIASNLAKEVANNSVEVLKLEATPVAEQKNNTAPVKAIETTQNEKLPTQNIEQTSPNNIEETSALTTFLAGIKNKIKSIDINSKITDIRGKFSGRIPENMPVTLALVLVPIICIMALFKLIKSSLERSHMLKKMLIENMAKRQNEIPSYDNIINNENLSWQEKFQQYRELANDEETTSDETDYNFIAKPKNITSQTEVPETKSKQIAPKELYSKGVILPKKPQTTKTTDNLERILQASPSIEKTEIEKDIEETETREFVTPEVAAEDDKIHKEITKTIKLKAFAEKMVLEETHRNKKIKHRRIQLELPKAEEAPHVNLGYSKLHSNPRTFQGAQLSVSDLIAKSNKHLSFLPTEISEPNETDDKVEPIEKIQPKATTDYEMISVDDYLNMVEEERPRATSPLSEVVANKLAKLKDKNSESDQYTYISRTTTNPITSLKNETKEDYMNGLIIKSGFNIDKERGFYLVSMDGKSAVIGRIGEEIFVLKKFDRNINKPLQVRMDNPNVYMVKADDFKSLVEVRKNDMGVLIEL